MVLHLPECSHFCIEGKRREASRFLVVSEGEIRDIVVSFSFLDIHLGLEGLVL